MRIHPKSTFLFVVLLFFFNFVYFASYAQGSLTSDGLFQAARKAAFDEKDYPKAKTFLYQALDVSPGYADIRVFLGRIYTWTHQYDSAKACFEFVLSRKPEFEDASLAYSYLEYWNDHYGEALGVCNKGLQYHPSSEGLLLVKGKILSGMRRFPAADSAVRQVLRLNTGNTEARSLADRIRELSVRNKINIGYDFVYFDKQFQDPWHLLSVDYGRGTGYGTFTGRINYANRFRDDGVQFELEAYPHISRIFYSYVEAAYSNNVGVFPQWRWGYSLYANLPSGFEGELGIRYLKFSGSPTWIYTAYLGRYYKNWLFGGRIYITPATYLNTVSNSYTASVRYYFGGADDYFGISAGYGISPDDRYNVIQLENKTKLISYNSGIVFKKKILRTEVFSASASWLNQEYLPHTKGNQFQIGVAWQHRF